MRIKLVSLPVLAFSAGLILTACDAVAEYTVVNGTDQPLITRALFEGDCQLVRGNRADYLPERHVEPFETLLYEDIYGAGIGSQGVKCIQVLTADRRLILAAPYEEGKRYEVAEPTTFADEPAPEISELPKQSGPDQILEGIREEPVQNAIAIGFFLVFFLIGLVLFVGTLAGIAYAAFLTVRRFYRYYRGTS